MALAATVCLLGGCDFFRQLAGRPTSRDIEAKKVLIEREAEEHQRRLDSLEKVQKQISDSLATLDSLRDAKGSIISTRQLATGGKYSLPYRYYVVIGSFASPDNAKRQAGKAEKAGYPATLIRTLPAIHSSDGTYLPSASVVATEYAERISPPADALIA